MNSRAFKVLLLASLVFLCGVQRSFGVQPDGPDTAVLDELMHAARPELKLHADDVISVQVFQAKDYGFQQRIARDGSMQFPLLGKLQLAGEGVQQAETQVAELLKERGFFQDPQVTINLVSQPSAIVTVSGNVTKPGVVPAFGDLTVSDCLSQAGGIIEYFPGSSPGSSLGSSDVLLIRPSLKEPVLIPLGADPHKAIYGRIPVFAGDEIYVKKVGIVYAVGAFKSQGAFSLKNNSATTVLQLVAMAGGIGFEADRSDAHILRTDGTKRYIVDVNVARILEGKAVDVALASDDILFVPTNQMKAAIKGGGTGLIVSMASAYLYATR